MVLYPARVERLKEEGQKEQRKWLDEAYEKYGREVDGEIVLPRTPEVERFLSGESDDQS